MGWAMLLMSAGNLHHILTTNHRGWYMDITWYGMSNLMVFISFCSTQANVNIGTKAKLRRVLHA